MPSESVSPRQARPLTIRADVPATLRQRVAWTLRQACTAWGLPIALSFGDVVGANSDDDITYSADGGADGSKWRLDPQCYEEGGAFSAYKSDGRLIWARGQANPDLLGGIYRLLSMLDEADVFPGARNRMGVFHTSALPVPRQAVLHRTLVEHHLDALGANVRLARPDLALEPRWPGGKRWALVITHDTDATRLGAPRELLYNAVKFVVRRERSRANMVMAGLRHIRTPMTDPYFGFSAWKEVEEGWGVKSAFYIFVRPSGVRRDVHDCRSSAADSALDLAVLRDLANQGWEFGLHASIHARDVPGGLERSRVMVETLLDRPVTGVRHHYWSIDWEAPWRTWQQHAAAGLRYDSSVAWRETPGFRAATSLPFQPFDPDRDTGIDLWVLPVAIMDSHLADGPAPDTRIALATEIVGEVRSVGGVLTLNWHTEAGRDQFDRAGLMELAAQIVEPALDGSDVWMTTPDELLDYWAARRDSATLTVVDA